MSISVFFILLFLIVGNDLFAGKTKSTRKLCQYFLVLRLILELNFSIGYAVRIADIEISYDSIVSFILILLSILLIIQQRKVSKRAISIGGALILSVVLGLILAEIHPYKGNVIRQLSGWDQEMQGNDARSMIEGVGQKNFLEFFNLVKWLIVAIVIRKLFIDREELFSAISIILNVSMLMIGCGYFEFFCENILHTDLLKQFLTFIFGSIHDVDKLGDTRIQGMMLEPSYYSYAAFQLSLLSICRLGMLKEKKQHEKYRYAAIIVIMLLSRSFSSIMYLILSLFTYGWFVLGKNKIKLFFKKAAYAIPATLIVCVTIGAIMWKVNGESLNYFWGRIQRLSALINRVIKTGSYGIFNSSSEAVRLLSILESLSIFGARPILGLGIGFVECHSTIISLLVSCGAIGTILWFMLVASSSVWKHSNKTIYIIYIISNFFIGSIGFLYSTVYLFVCLSYSAFYGKAVAQ